jgi:hypothetical protein
MTFAPGISLARVLGWFSIGLGVAELVAPESITRMTGVKNQTLIKFCGLREIATGVAVLSSGRPTIAMWGRVVGDAMDLATLADAMVDNDHAGRVQATKAAVAVAGVTALDFMAASELTAASRMEG